MSVFQKILQPVPTKTVNKSEGERRHILRKMQVFIVTVGRMFLSQLCVAKHADTHLALDYDKCHY